MKTNDLEPVSRRMNLSFLLTATHTPNTIFQYFLELSDVSDAYSRILKMNRKRQRLWPNILFFSDLRKVFAAREMDADRPDLLLHELPKPGLFDWPGRYSGFLRFAGKERIPLLLVPEGMPFRPAKKIFSVACPAALPERLGILADDRNLEYIAFQPRPERSSLMNYMTSRFDETGYAAAGYSAVNDLLAQLEKSRADMIMISSEVESTLWGALVKQKLPVLVCPGSTKGKSPTGKLSGKLAASPVKKFKFL